jgi:hypothetical protein
MCTETKDTTDSHQGAIHFTEVQFHFTKMFGDNTQTFALVLLYHLPNQHFVQTTYDTLVVCRYLCEGVLIVIDTKLILLVVGMAPFCSLINGHGDQDSLIEKIGLDVTEADNLEDNE